jgi:hypothetical protein
MRSRRDFVTLSVASIAAGFPLGSPTRQQTRLPTADTDALRSEFLFDLTLDTQPPITIGSPGGDRVIVAVTGGSFQGPRLKGTVAAGGGDWIVQRPDRSRVVDVRIVMTTDDGQKIYVSWRGIAYIENGTFIARIVPMFETDSDKYGWLNRIVSVGVYRPSDGKVAFRLYRIL